MTAPIGALSSIGAIGSAPVGAAAAATPTAAASPATSAVAAANLAAAQSTSGSFGTSLSQALQGVQATQSNADNLAVQAATGNMNDVTNYMVAAEQANVATQLTVAVRNNAVQAFQQIMDMPL